MDWFEICIVVLCAVVVSMYLVCAVDFCVLARRYKKFYETTEEGKRLYCALYTKDRLGSKHDWLVNQMTELRDKINEFEFYFPDGRAEKAFLHGMKVQYKEYSEELAHTKEAMANWDKGILEYNWENAKVEVKEESVCW